MGHLSKPSSLPLAAFRGTQNSMRIPILPTTVLLTFFLLAACVTTKPTASVPLSETQLKGIAARAKAPQMFGITVYPSDAGPVFAGAARLHEGDVAAVSFPRNGWPFAPIVPLSPGGTDQVLALLDTSSPQCWVTPAGAREIELDMLAAPSLLVSRPTHVFDTASGYLGVASHAKIDTVNLENVLMQMRGMSGSLGPLARGLDDTGIEAVLGVDLMKAFNHIQFNFPARHVVLSASREYSPSESNLVATVPLLFANGAVATEGMLGPAKQTFILDTGGEYAVALPTNSPSASFPQISLGDLVLRDVAGVSGMDLALGQISQPRIGRRLLAKFKMTIDFRARLIHFERP